MEIALYALSAIGAAAVLLFFYCGVRDVINHSTEIENLRKWNRLLDQNVDKAHERYWEIDRRVKALEEPQAKRRK